MDEWNAPMGCGLFVLAGLVVALFMLPIIVVYALPLVLVAAITMFAAQRTSFVGGLIAFVVSSAAFVLFLFTFTNAGYRFAWGATQVDAGFLFANSLVEPRTNLPSTPQRVAADAAWEEYWRAVTLSGGRLSTYWMRNTDPDRQFYEARTDALDEQLSRLLIRSSMGLYDLAPNQRRVPSSAPHVLRGFERAFGVLESRRQRTDPNDVQRYAERREALCEGLIDVLPTIYRYYERRAELESDRTRAGAALDGHWSPLHESASGADDLVCHNTQGDARLQCILEDYAVRGPNEAARACVSERLSRQRAR